MDAIILTKTNARASVHRPGYMDYIGVLKFDDNGTPVVEQRFLGLFASGAYTRRPWDIPLVRQKYEAVMERSGLRRDSHSGKALRNILETLPRDELFQASDDELFETATGILQLQGRARSRLFVRGDKYGRFLLLPGFHSARSHSPPMCANASRTCSSARSTASAWTRRSRSANRRSRACI